jgi:hypothetical protein
MLGVGALLGKAQPSSARQKASPGVGIMANDIFQFMQAGLGNLMSPRAAKRMLTGALRRHRLRPESVTPQQMLGAVSGPLRQDLKTLLPTDVADRQVARLTRALERRYGPGGALPTTEPNPEPNPAPPSDTAALAGSEAAPTTRVADEPVTETEALTHPAFASAGDSAAALAESAAPAALPTPVQQAGAASAPLPAAAPGLTQTPGRPVPSPPAAPVAVLAKPLPVRPREAKPLDPRAQDRLLVAFAQLEDVRMVALLGRQGEVLASRGTGFELPALSRLGTLALALLERSGELRSFYLAQPRGQLFLFPFPGALLLVIGSAEVNLGQVFATLQKLKEDL